MKRTIGFLMLVGLMVGIVGCGDDNNPVKSDEDLLVGTWLEEDGDEWTFSADGTFVDWEGDSGTWSINGDKMTWTEETGSISINWTFSVTDESLTLSLTIDGETESQTFTRKK